MGNEQFQIINELQMEESEIDNIEKNVNYIESKIKEIIKLLKIKFYNIIIKNKKRIENLRKIFDLLKKSPNNEFIKDRLQIEKMYFIKNKNFLNEYKTISDNFSNEMFTFLNNNLQEKKYFYEYSIQKVINNNTSQINNICILENNDFIISTKDKSIILYNHEDYSIKLIKNNLEYFITYIINLDNNLIATASFKEITILKLLNNNTNYEIKQKLKKHENWINKLIKINNSYFLSCSSDNLIKVYYKIKKEIKYEEMLSIKSHEEQINSLYLINENIFSSLSSIESTLKIWNTISFNSIKTFYDIEGSSWPDSICKVNNKLISVCSSFGIYLINYIKLQIEKLLKINNYFTCIIKLNNDNFLCSKYYEDNNNEYHYDIYEFRTNLYGNEWGIISRKNNIHNGDINSIVQLNNNIIITISKDHNIIIWK